MAELVDALASGASDLMVVEVQVLFWAPTTIFSKWFCFEAIVKNFTAIDISLLRSVGSLRDLVTAG